MSTETGRRAETAAAQYLGSRGFMVLEQNWRTRWCEIDLIARQGRTISFIEVKYRANNNHGSGLDYITSQKLQQMHFAAEFWLAQGAQDDYEYRLAALEVSGIDFAVTAWVNDL